MARQLVVGRRYVRAPEVRATIDSSGVVGASARGAMVRLRSGGLLLLDAFGKPSTVADAVRTLPAASARDFIVVTSAIGQLVDAGVLTDADSDAELPESTDGWDATEMHVRMLRDESRTDAFRRAIEEVVRPGDVVLDIGTGTGVLAAFAARAGARKVYAVEASGIGCLAAENFRRNGLDDRIELVRGWSTQVVLPERADVLVTETIGNEPLGERIVDTVFDAVRRHLVAKPRIIPGRIRVVGTLVDVPTEFAARHLFTNENVARIHERYGLDLSAMREAECRSTTRLCIRHAEARSLRPLGAPFTLADVDLLTQDLVFSAHANAPVTSSGTLRGVLSYFDAELGPTTSFSLAPEQTSDQTSWGYTLWLVPDREVRTGDSVALRYSYSDGAARLSALEPPRR